MRDRLAHGWATFKHWLDYRTIFSIAVLLIVIIIGLVAHHNITDSNTKTNQVNTLISELSTAQGSLAKAEALETQNGQLIKGNTAQIAKDQQTIRVLLAEIVTLRQQLISNGVAPAGPNPFSDPNLDIPPGTTSNSTTIIEPTPTPAPSPKATPSQGSTPTPTPTPTRTSPVCVSVLGITLGC